MYANFHPQASSTPTCLYNLRAPLATAKESPQLQGANQRGKGAKGGIISSSVVCSIICSHYGDLCDDIPTSSVLFGG